MEPGAHLSSVESFMRLSRYMYPAKSMRSTSDSFREVLSIQFVCVYLAVAGDEHTLGCKFRQYSYDGLAAEVREPEHSGIGRVGNDFRRCKEENRQGNEVW